MGGFFVSESEENVMNQAGFGRDRGDAGAEIQEDSCKQNAFFRYSHAYRGSAHPEELRTPCYMLESLEDATNGGVYTSSVSIRRRKLLPRCVLHNHKRRENPPVKRAIRLFHPQDN
jgi:hypothetical protein